ncbi:unnamed protein product, partial [Mesorhabditis belari]|uniref:C-type lectin domain-containing protein n=1 Tax=Mesorhabditis belari TaxID=2138241 RepID=A0AAF3J1I4_9BILA
MGFFVNFLYFHILLTISWGQCPSGSEYIQPLEACLIFYNHANNYEAAEKICGIYGGNLTSIHSAFESNLAAVYMAKDFNSLQAYIGLKRINNQWQWIDGSTANYFKWGSDQPTVGDCAVLHSDWLIWLSVDCNTPFPFICKLADVVERCAAGWSFYERTNQCYHIGHNKSFEDAETYCGSFGGHLASVHDSVENEFIFQLAYKATCVREVDVWVAGTTLLGGRYNKAADAVVWSDGSASNYRHEVCMNAGDGGPVLLSAYPATCGGVCADGTWSISGYPIKTVYPSFVCKAPAYSDEFH